MTKTAKKALARIERARSTLKVNAADVVRFIAGHGVTHAHAFGDGRLVYIMRIEVRGGTAHAIRLMNGETGYEWMHLNPMKPHLDSKSAAVEAQNVFGFSNWNILQDGVVTIPITINPKGARTDAHAC